MVPHYQPWNAEPCKHLCQQREPRKGGKEPKTRGEQARPLCAEQACGGMVAWGKGGALTSEPLRQVPTWRVTSIISACQPEVVLNAKSSWHFGNKWSSQSQVACLGEAERGREVLRQVLRGHDRGIPLRH